MPTSDRLLHDASTGLASSAEFTENMQDIEDAILYETGGPAAVGSVLSGAIPTAPGGLTLRIPISTYLIGVYRGKEQTDVVLTNNATNRVYAVTDPDDDEGISYVVKTDTTIPARSALRAYAVTSGGAITSILRPYTNRRALPGISRPAQITANQDNYSLEEFENIFLNTDASRNITGFVATWEGDKRLILNNGAQNIVLKHDVTSTAGNRIRCDTLTDITLAANKSIWIIYDATIGYWRTLS